MGIITADWRDSNIFSGASIYDPVMHNVISEEPSQQLTSQSNLLLGEVLILMCSIINYKK